ncbi:MAG TPA: ribonuclease HII, partial [Steroidobacteraceae bacterium]|nr:ribonuclease HII [Steroidobacteraceae bacterium]
EAGRGPLAGPVVAAAVILDPQRVIVGLRDSKQLRPAARERLAQCIRREALGVAVAEVDAPEIDRLNILQATLEAMRRALLALRAAGVRPACVMIDGNCAPQLPDWLGGCALETLVGGDALVPAISAASIIAKTHRDALMRGLDQVHPGYGLALHFGYGTRMHMQALSQLGPSPIHRRSFNPLRGWLSGALAPGSLPPGLRVRES